MNGFSSTQLRILSIVKRLGERMEGRKKLMKLCFFLNHYDFEEKERIKSPIFNEEFVVYHFGPFSFEIRDEYMKLVNSRDLIDSFPIEIKPGIGLDLDKENEKRIDIMLSKIGSRLGWQLEDESLRLLGITKRTKKDFFGKNVSELISREREKFEIFK